MASWRAQQIKLLFDLRRERPRVSQLSRRATLRRLLTENISLSRFGDGELIYCLKGRSLRFQRYEKELSERLLQTLLHPPPGVLVAFNNYLASRSEIPWLVAYERYPKTFAYYRTVKNDSDVGIFVRHQEQRAYARFWRRVSRHTTAGEYGDAAVFFLGTYVEEYESGDIESVLEDFRALFLRRRILFVGPKVPLGGLSFEAQEASMRAIGLRSAQFCIIPNSDAFSQRTVIQEQILNRSGFDDVFIQAGPLASILASELANKIDGRILDVGSLNTQLRYLV